MIVPLLAVVVAMRTSAVTVDRLPALVKVRLAERSRGRVAL